MCTVRMNYQQDTRVTCAHVECADNPSALQSQIIEHYGGISTLQFNALYSVYSFPNIVLPFFGGLFVDKFGLTATTLAFLSFCTLGQMLFALSATLESYPLAIVGRLIFGFGGESMSVALSTILVRLSCAIFHLLNDCESHELVFPIGRVVPW